MPGVRGARVHLVLPRREPSRATRRGAGQRDAHHGGRGAAGPRGRAGDPQPGRRRGARACGRRTSPSSTAAATCWRAAAKRSAGPATALSSEEVRRAHRTAPRPRGRGDAGAQPRPRPGARRGHGRMNFDRVNQSEERFDPDSQVTRSPQSVTTEQEPRHRAGRSHGRRTTCRTPMPAGRRRLRQESRQEETTNYEIGRTTRTRCASSRRSSASRSR